MFIERFIWDLDDEPNGNVQHIAEHGLSIDEVEEVLLAADELLASHTSSRPIVFGETSTGKLIAVVFDIVDEDPMTVYPVTAYEPDAS